MRRTTLQRGALQEMIRNLTTDKVAIACAVLVGLIAIVAITAPLLQKIGWIKNPYEMNLRDQVSPPSRLHALGTDSYGRDLLSRLIFGARISLSVGLVAVAISTLFGLTFGLTAAYFGGVVDSLIMRLMDALLALPPILLALVFIATMGPGVKNVMLALGIVYSPRLARVVRAKALSVKEETYVLAARAIGAAPIHIMLKHIVPNILGSVLVQIIVAYAYSIVAEAGMSFLGLGTQPPTPSWGLMMSEGKRYIVDAPWYLLFPGLAVSILVLSITLLGDRLRVALDPRQR